MLGKVGMLELPGDIEGEGSAEGSIESRKV